MANEKLYITISDNRGGTNKPDGEGSDNKEKTGLLGEYAKHQFMHLIKRTANQMISFGISQIGFLDGNNQQQKNVEAVKSLVDGMLGIGMSALAGAKVGGVPGALIGVGVSITGQVFGSLQSLHYGFINNNRQNHEIDMLRQRAGLDNLTNDSDFFVFRNK